MVKQKKTKYTSLPLSSLFEDASLSTKSPKRESSQEKRNRNSDYKKEQPCKYGEECKRSDCVFYILEKKCQKSLSTKKQKDVKTRMCKYVKKVQQRKKLPICTR